VVSNWIQIGCDLFGASVNNLTETEKAYIAGLIDGEGCLTITKQMLNGCVNYSYAILVIVSMTDERVIRYLHKVTGIGAVHFIRPPKPEYKDQWTWQLSRFQALELIAAIVDYLIVKQDEARLILEFAQIPIQRRKFGAIDPATSALRESYRIRVMNMKHIQAKHIPEPEIIEPHEKQLSLL
jgi:hypothetical protein